MTPDTVAVREMSVGDESLADLTQGEDGDASSQHGGAVASNAFEITKKKRKMWATRAMAVLPDIYVVLDSTTRIKSVSPSISVVAHWQPADIEGLFLRDLVHPDDSGLTVAELNDSIASGDPFRFFFRLRKGKDRPKADVPSSPSGPANGPPAPSAAPAANAPGGTGPDTGPLADHIILEVTGHAHIAMPEFSGNPVNKSPFCQAVFMMWRPYWTKSMRVMDRVLEAKMENLRLRRAIAELRAENERDEADDRAESLSSARSSRRESIDDAGSDASGLVSSQWTNAGGRDAALMPPPPLPAGATSSGAGAGSWPGKSPTSRTASGSLTAANLQAASLQPADAGYRQDLVRDKVARLQTKVEGISGAVGIITGDAGITISPDARTTTKRNKRAAKEQVCTDCGKKPVSLWLAFISSSAFRIPR